MDLLGFTLLYMGLVGACLFAMLFGELRIFRGTPIAKLQWFITGGFCDYLWWAVEGTCGKSGKRSLAKVEDVCCNRPNPVLQVLYVALLLAAYYLYSRDIFSLLPLPYAPSWHRYTGTAAVGACLLSFYTTSVSDPGAVDADNLGAHLAIYDYDDVTSFQKDCWTCMQQRPARSKHCPVCNRCIARFDHHCAWVNNCIGLFNLRWFLAFLLANILLCTYAVVLACTVFYGEMHRHHVWNLVMLDYNTGSLIALKDSPRRIAQWLVTHYTVAVTLTAFLAIAALLVGSFLGYHMHLVACGMTTYETFKRSEFKRSQLDHQHDQQQQAEAGQQDRSGHEGWRCGSARQRMFGGSTPGKEIVMPRHTYNTGFRQNMLEVLFPEDMLQAASRTHQAQAPQTVDTHMKPPTRSKKQQ